MEWKKFSKFEITNSFPDGATKCVFTDGSEETAYPDGIVQSLEPNGVRTI